MDNLFQLGEASHISIGVKDIQDSLEFYKQLAFHTVTQGEEPSPWMHISDGSILISLNQDERSYMGLTYYASDMEKRVAMLKEKGIRFREYGDLTDQKQNWWFTTPDGFHVQLIKSETKFIFQPEGKTLFNFPEENFIFPEKYPNMQCGIFGEIFHRINAFFLGPQS